LCPVERNRNISSDRRVTDLLLRLELRNGIFSSKTLVSIFVGAAVVGVIAGARGKSKTAKRQRKPTRH